MVGVERQPASLALSSLTTGKEHSRRWGEGSTQTASIWKGTAQRRKQKHPHKVAERKEHVPSSSLLLGRKELLVTSVAESWKGYGIANGEGGRSKLTGGGRCDQGNNPRVMDSTSWHPHSPAPLLFPDVMGHISACSPWNSLAFPHISSCFVGSPWVWFISPPSFKPRNVYWMACPVPGLWNSPWPQRAHSLAGQTDMITANYKTVWLI